MIWGTRGFLLASIARRLNVYRGNPRHTLIFQFSFNKTRTRIKGHKNFTFVFEYLECVDVDHRRLAVYDTSLLWPRLPRTTSSNASCCSLHVSIMSRRSSRIWDNFCNTCKRPSWTEHKCHCCSSRSLNERHEKKLFYKVLDYSRLRLLIEVLEYASFQ